jgi:hypothetical protein
VFALSELSDISASCTSCLRRSNCRYLRAMLSFGTSVENAAIEDDLFMAGHLAHTRVILLARVLATGM